MPQVVKVFPLSPYADKEVLLKLLPNAEGRALTMVAHGSGWNVSGVGDELTETHHPDIGSHGWMFGPRRPER